MSNGKTGPLIIKTQKTYRCSLCVDGWGGYCNFQGVDFEFLGGRTDESCQQWVRWRERRGSMYFMWLGYAPINGLFLPADEYPPSLKLLLYLYVSCQNVSMCVCARVHARVYAHPAKWNGRSWREYNRGPTEEASRHNSSLLLTL